MSKVYPVIHYKNDETTLSEAVKAHNAGADGVFLISHIGHNERLIPLAVEIKEKLKMEVGLNFLGETALYTAKIVRENALDMIWADYCGVSSEGLEYEGHDLADWACLNESIKVFASVAFKYQGFEPNPSLAASEALKAGFIPTTSGSGTGSAPSVDKIRDMSVATQGTLAVASGMTCDNINEFKPYLSHILVATGISDDEYHFNIEKLRTFIALAHS
jgi:predicted TIM-barrel enzyme